MRKTIKKSLLTLLLIVSIFNTGTASYNTTPLSHIDEYEVELYFFDDNDDSDTPFPF